MRSNEATPSSSQATASPSMMQERERRRASASTISGKRRVRSLPGRLGVGIGPARMICVTSEVLSAHPVDRPTAVDLAEIAVASGLKFIGLLGRKLAAFVFDNESSLLDRRCRKKTQAGARTANTESSLAGHIR